MALVPLNLFVTHDGKSRRQHVTCRYKCGDACSKPVRNTSDNEYFGDIAKEVSRRSILQAERGRGAGGRRRFGAGRMREGRTARSDPDLVDGASGRNTRGHEVRRRRAQQRGRRRHPRGLQAGRRDQLGRPDSRRCAEVRCPQPDRRRPAWSVRLQQRLRGSAADRRPAEPIPSGHQPRVRHAVVHVPRLQGGRADPRAVRRRDRGDRHGCRRGRTHPRRWAAAGDGPLQPAHHRRHPDDARRARGRHRLRQDDCRPGRPHGCRHLRQLFGRCNPLGHSALRRGEFPGVLRRGRRLGEAQPGGRRPLRPLRDSAGAVGAVVGDIRPALRPVQERRTSPTGSATSSRSIRGTRTRPR